MTLKVLNIIAENFKLLKHEKNNYSFACLYINSVSK